MSFESHLDVFVCPPQHESSDLFGSSDYTWDTLIETHSHTDDTTWGNKQSVCFSQTPPGWNGCFCFSRFSMVFRQPSTQETVSVPMSLYHPATLRRASGWCNELLSLLSLLLLIFGSCFGMIQPRGHPQRTCVTAGGATFSSDCEWHWWSFSLLITLESVMSMGKMLFFDQAWFVTHKRLISFKKRSRMSPNAFGKRWKEEFSFFHTWDMDHLYGCFQK